MSSILEKRSIPETVTDSEEMNQIWSFRDDDVLMILGTIKQAKYFQ